LAGIGFPLGSPQADLGGRAHQAEVSFLAPPRTHTAGHELTFATGRCRAGD